MSEFNDNRYRWREAHGLRFLLMDSPRPEHCGVHTHEVPLMCMLLQGEIQEADDRNRIVHRGPHTLNISAAGESHAHRILTERVKTLCVAFDEPFQALLGEDAKLFDMHATVKSGRLLSFIPRLHREILATDQASDMVIEGLVVEFAGELKRRLERPPSGDAPSWLKTAREVIRDRCSESFGVAEVAREVGVHPCHLARVFRTYLGESPGEYLRRVRLERATREVVQTRMQLGVIAERAGFADQAHFSREFRRMHGITPMEYRQSVNALLGDNLPGFKRSA